MDLYLKIGIINLASFFLLRFIMKMLFIEKVISLEGNISKTFGCYVLITFFYSLFCVGKFVINL